MRIKMMGTDAAAAECNSQEETGNNNNNNDNNNNRTGGVQQEEKADNEKETRAATATGQTTMPRQKEATSLFKGRGEILISSEPYAAVLTGADLGVVLVLLLHYAKTLPY